MEESLAHYGKLGMKWGVRKEQEATYRAKLSKIQNNKNVNPSDAKRFAYRNQSAASRITKTATSVVIHQVVRDVLTGDIRNYGSMSKVDIAKKARNIAINTAANVAVKDALAKSASKRYTNSGKRQPGTKDHIITKEDAIGLGINVGIKAAYVGGYVGKMKYAQAAAQRTANEARFNAWGKNILPQKVDNVIWSNDDMAIIDNRRR